MNLIKSGNEKLDEAISNWLKWDKNLSTRQEVLDAVNNLEWEILKQKMLGRIKFGTAGLRGKMCAGFKNMNDVIVIQTAQGLCAYYKKVFSDEQLKNGVVVGFDGRYNSRRFAELTTKVFTEASIKVHLFSNVCPTPYISYTTIKYGCVGGIMVTASHNPKEDNGYKVYWCNGSQIITPHDDNILNAILDNLEIPEHHWVIDDIRSHHLVSDPFEEISQSYSAYIQSCLSQDILERNKRIGLSVVYSAMHGVGYPFILQSFEVAMLKEPIAVKEQIKPDPEFPTVKFPNPEETECLDLSIKLAEQKAVNLVLVNDPDADRLAVAEYQVKTNTWKVFSGNEIGILLGWWLLNQYKQKGDISCSNLYFLASIVSSKMLKSIAKKENCNFVETLTGFKWMGNKCLMIQESGGVPLFAYEEAIGFMCNARVPDKDGVSAAVQVASLATYLHELDLSLLDKLNDLYKEYGYHTSYNSYFICHDQPVMSMIFHNIRNYDGTNQYPMSAGGRIITAINDISHPDKIKCNSSCDDTDLIGTGLDLPYTSGEMIIFTCEGGLTVTLRTSGTEPKLKYYAEIIADAQSQEQQQRVCVSLRETIKQFVDDLLKPDLYGLKG